MKKILKKLLIATACLRAGYFLEAKNPHINQKNLEIIRQAVDDAMKKGYSSSLAVSGDLMIACSRLRYKDEEYNFAERFNKPGCYDHLQSINKYFSLQDADKARKDLEKDFAEVEMLFKKEMDLQKIIVN